jgi:hypothetical protein
MRKFPKFMKSKILKIFFPLVSLIALSSCVQVQPQDPDRYREALDAASDEDFRDRDRERRSAADAIRASGQQAPSYHYHQQRNNFFGW